LKNYSFQAKLRRHTKDSLSCGVIQRRYSSALLEYLSVPRAVGTFESSMKFGRNLSRNVVPEWSSSYINYKALKKLIKSTAEDVKEGKDADLAGE
jgi:hypothetical protein